MPYYVFRVRPLAQFDKLGEFTAFKEASAHAKALRAAAPAPGQAAPRDRIKVMFAEHEEQAVDLLCQVRDPGPIGDD